MYGETLKLVAHLSQRRPAAGLPERLHQLFCRLPAVQVQATEVEDEIWHLWMQHPHDAASRALDRAADDIAGQRFDLAETRLYWLCRACPAFPEAWHKSATLYYLLERDDESVHAIHRTLELEPRHFGALCALGEICMGRGDRDAALMAFQAALRLNPHLAAARDALARLLAGDAPGKGSTTDAA